VLVALTRGDAGPSLSLLQHTATIAALQVERLTSQREEERRLGAELLASLVDGRIDSGVAQHLLASRGLDGKALIMVACADEEPREGPGLHHTLADRAIPHLILRQDATMLLLPAQREILAALREDVAEGARLGISDPFQGPVRVADATREAQWALAAAERDSKGLVHYGEDAPLFLPRTIGEGERVVQTILGPLLDYDRGHRSELVQSLRVFLSCNRSWLQAARELHVHKQTLVYRMRRIEQLTGRHLNSTGDVAELWLALRVLELSSGEPAELVTPVTQKARANQKR